MFREKMGYQLKTGQQPFQGVKNNWLMIKRKFFRNMKIAAGNRLISIDHLERAGRDSEPSGE
jgi:hypothetical protein